MMFDPRDTDGFINGPVTSLSPLYMLMQYLEKSLGSTPKAALNSSFVHIWQYELLLTVMMLEPKYHFT